MSETAVFCAVCGARFDEDAIAATSEATQVVEGPQDAPAPSRWSDAQPFELNAELVSENGSEQVAAAETAPQPEEHPLDRKLAAVAVLLTAAGECEVADVSRAAALYQEAILDCLDASDEADGCSGVDQELLRGFDGLSALLERKGLAEEALAVVDDAAALGLLDGGASAVDGHRAALTGRREALRRLLFADSAQL